MRKPRPRVKRSVSNHVTYIKRHLTLTTQWYIDKTKTFRPRITLKQIRSMESITKDGLKMPTSVPKITCTPTNKKESITFTPPFWDYQTHIEFIKRYPKWEKGGQKLNNLLVLAQFLRSAFRCITWHICSSIASNSAAPVKFTTNMLNKKLTWTWPTSKLDVGPGHANRNICHRPLNFF